MQWHDCQLLWWYKYHKISNPQATWKHNLMLLWIGAIINPKSNKHSSSLQFILAILYIIILRVSYPVVFYLRWQGSSLVYCVRNYTDILNTCSLIRSLCFSHIYRSAQRVGTYPRGISSWCTFEICILALWRHKTSGKLLIKDKLWSATRRLKGINDKMV